MLNNDKLHASCGKGISRTWSVPTMGRSGEPVGAAAIAGKDHFRQEHRLFARGSMTGNNPNRLIMPECPVDLRGS